MNEEVIAAYYGVVEQIEKAHHPLDQRWPRQPICVDTDYGRCERLSAVWFLPVDGTLTNHGFSVDEYARGTWHVRAWTHAGPVADVKVIVREAPGSELLTWAARAVGLLPRDGMAGTAPLPVGVEYAYAEGYREAVARLRDDTRYRDWWTALPKQDPAYGYWQGPARRHLADYLETVGPDGIDVTTGRWPAREQPHCPHCGHACNHHPLQVGP